MHRTRGIADAVRAPGVPGRTVTPARQGTCPSDQTADRKTSARRRENDQSQRRLELPEEERDRHRLPILQHSDRDDDSDERHDHRKHHDNTFHANRFCYGEEQWTGHHRAGIGL